MGRFSLRPKDIPSYAILEPAEFCREEIHASENKVNTNDLVRASSELPRSRQS